MHAISFFYIIEKIRSVDKKHKSSCDIAEKTSKPNGNPTTTTSLYVDMSLYKVRKTQLHVHALWKNYIAKFLKNNLVVFDSWEIDVISCGSIVEASHDRKHNRKW